MIEVVLNTENKPQEADLQQNACREMLRQHLSSEEGGGGAAGGVSQSVSQESVLLQSKFPDE